MSAIIGKSFIGYRRPLGSSDSFRATNPSTGEALEPDFSAATSREVEDAVVLAHQAFQSFGRSSRSLRGKLLRAIAANIEDRIEPVVDRATTETGLPEARIRSESARTCFQLRMFADFASEGSWVDARIDRPDSKRQPLPKPDVRSMLVPLGPVVVFCASNFPLAFSVAGGDTASALATGNTVVVKAHRSHPGTAELVASAVVDAVRSCDLPEGVFSMLFGKGEEIGIQLIRHPLIQAGGFTGSRAGGLTLLHAATTRRQPIPFYAEMSSVNPVFIFPEALRERENEIATGLHASVTLGAGQFCTNPGIVFIPEKPLSEGLITKLRDKMTATPAFVMLSSRICRSYLEGAGTLAGHRAIETLVETSCNSSSLAKSTSALYMTDVESFIADPLLSVEVFGPATLLVTYSNTDQLAKAARQMEGQLTATVHATASEISNVSDLLQILESKAGRIVFNGYPTGVEVGNAMVHGGPYPATSDGKSTSVGTRAAFRFVRSVCFQDAPQDLLPDELKDGNPCDIWRMIDGELSRA